MEILNENRFTCRVTNNAIFALTVSLYLSSTQIIIAATRNEEMYIRLFYCQIRKMYAQSTCRSASISLCPPTFIYVYFCGCSNVLYSDNIQKTDIFSRLHSRQCLECLLISSRFLKAARDSATEGKKEEKFKNGFIVIAFG